METARDLEAILDDVRSKDDEPAPRRVLDDPIVRARIGEGLTRIEEAKVSPGRSADELLDLAREQLDS